MKSIYLKDIINTMDSQEINIELIVREKNVGVNTIEYILGDITGDIKYNSKTNFDAGEIVTAVCKNNDIKNAYKYEGNYTLKDFMPYSPKHIDTIMKELEELTTNTFTDQEAIRLDNYFFSNKGFIKLFSTGIGGFGHHIYIGGLAEHTLNVVYWTNSLAERYHCKYRDIAVLSAKLHDIGKIYEYSHVGAFKSTFRGEMEGHIVIGIEMIEEAFKNDSFSYSEDFKNRVKGCIVQHHGMPEYGSPKSPNTEEAYMVHFADYIDATMSKISKLKSETPENSWSAFNEDLKTKIFIQTIKAVYYLDSHFCLMNVAE